MRTWHQWDWRREPYVPLSWPDPEQRIVLCEPFAQDTWDAAGLMSGDGIDFERACESGGERGVVFVFPYDALYLRGRREESAHIPALLVRRKHDLGAVDSLIDVRAKNRAMLIEPEEPIDLGVDTESTVPLGMLGCRTCGGFGSVRYPGFDTEGNPNEGTCLACDGAGRVIDLVIVRGREKPLLPAWVRGIRDQCQAAGVAFHFAGWGNFTPDHNVTGDMRVTEADGVVTLDRKTAGPANGFHLWRVGAQHSGRMLDGREWLEVPEGL